MHWSIKGIWTTPVVIVIEIVVVEVCITINVPYIVSIIGRPRPTSNEDKITTGLNLADLSQYYLYQ